MDIETSDNLASQDFSYMEIDDGDGLNRLNTKNMKCKNTDVVLPDSTDLDWAQITYALNYKRLIFINNYKTWLNFHSDSENGYKYTDYSPEVLSYRFLHRVLPNIFEYELTEDELHLLNILDLHPNFKRNENGFYAMQQEALAFPSNESAIEMLTSQSSSLFGTDFVAGNVHTNNQIAVTGPIGDGLMHRKFNFNEENAILLSVVLSSDEDLPNCELLTIEEIHKRLKAAKTRFEYNGQQLENVNISVESLFKKLKTINELKAAIAQLVNKSLSAYWK